MAAENSPEGVDSQGSKGRRRDAAQLHRSVEEEIPKRCFIPPPPGLTGQPKKDFWPGPWGQGTNQYSLKADFNTYFIF